SFLLVLDESSEFSIKDFFAYWNNINKFVKHIMFHATLVTLSMNLSLELTRALVGGIGIVLTIPISIYTATYFIHKRSLSK
ncbi:hypothetical protein SAMN04488114_14319, partial [Carnobacterium iners]